MQRMGLTGYDYKKCRCCHWFITSIHVDGTHGKCEHPVTKQGRVRKDDTCDEFTERKEGNSHV